MNVRLPQLESVFPKFAHFTKCPLPCDMLGGPILKVALPLTTFVESIVTIDL